MNFLSGDGTGMTVEGNSAKDGPAIQIIKKHTARFFVFFILRPFQVLATQADLPLVPVLLMLGIDAVQLQESGLLGQLHIHPTMGMTFSKIVTDRWLTNDLNRAFLAVLPIMGMTVYVGFRMLSLSKQF